MKCRLCGGSTNPLTVSKKPLRAYSRCSRCCFIQVEAPDLPSPEAEKTRYLLHRNNPRDGGYSAWLQTFIDEAVLPFAVPGSRILDFGSGPEPLLGTMLARLGYAVTLFDPFFAPSPAWETGYFDMIVMHEVFEHLADPLDAFKCLLQRCSPGGRICLRTGFLPDTQAGFDSWWYRSDSTHIGFIARETAIFMARTFALRLEYDNNRDIAVFKTPGGS